MSDISKCRGTNCPLANTCYRYLADSDDIWQAYITEIPIKPDNTCDYYWQVSTESELNILNKENDIF